MSTDQKWSAPEKGKRAGFGKFLQPKSDYDLFMESEGVPVFRGIGCRSVLDLPLSDWPRLGGRGSYIQLDGTEGKWGFYVIEIPPGRSLEVEKHLYEKVMFVIEGRGSTEVWQKEGQKPQSFEWGKGALFSVPVNTWHRLVNATNRRAFLAVGTTAPNLINLIGNLDFIFNCDYQFTGRYNQEDGYFDYYDDYEPDPIRGLAMQKTNYIPDIINAELPLDNRRSKGYRRVEPQMAGNKFYIKIGEHETGRYSKAHAHTSATVLMSVKGRGYTYTWPESAGVNPWQEGKEDLVERVDYDEFGIVTAAPGGARWYHQHFNCSREGFRLIMWNGPNHPSLVTGLAPGKPQIDYTGMDITEGGTSIPYWMEDPAIRIAFEKRLRDEGAESKMEEALYEKPQNDREKP